MNTATKATPNTSVSMKHARAGQVLVADGRQTEGPGGARIEGTGRRSSWTATGSKLWRQTHYSNASTARYYVCPLVLHT